MTKGVSHRDGYKMSEQLLKLANSLVGSSSLKHSAVTLR